MSKEKPKVFSRDVKLGAVRRLEAGENVAALARELGVARQVTYTWRKRVLEGGPEALQGKGRPHTVPLGSVVLAPVSAQARVADLERTIGRLLPALAGLGAARGGEGRARRASAGGAGEPALRFRAGGPAGSGPVLPQRRELDLGR